MEDLLMLIGVILILWLVWFFTGGPTRWNQGNESPYVYPSAPVQNSNSSFGEHVVW